MTAFDDAVLGDRIRHAFDGYGLPVPAARPTPQGYPRPTRRWLAPIGVVAVALVLVVPLVTAPPSAFATWTPNPSVEDAAVIAAVAPTCTVDPGPEAPAQERLYHQQMAALPLAVVDQRGRAAMLFYAERRPAGIATNLCLGAVDAFGTYLGGGSGGGLGATEQPADGPIRIVSGARNTRHGPDIWTMLRGGDTYTAYAGTVTPDVARVVVQRNEGVAVTASVDDGFFAAWWPGTAHATSFQAFDTEGDLITSLVDQDWTFPD